MLNRTTILLILGLVAFGTACKREKEQKSGVDIPDRDPGLEALTAQIESNPKNDTLYFQRASLYYQLQGYDEALRDLHIAMEIDSMQPAYYHLLADVLIDYARPNDSRRAIDVLQLATERFPDRILTLLKLSEFQLIVQQHNEALSTLEKILLRDPQNAEAFFMIGRVALDMGDTTRSTTALQKSARLNADNVDAWMFLGKIFSNRNDDQALVYFNNALRLDSTLYEARELKGAFHKRKGEFDQAFQEYEELIQRNPDYSNAYFDMGLIYLEIDSLQKARDNFDIAIKTDPLFVRAYYYRGLAFEFGGQLDQALADYEQAAKMAPGFTEAVEAAKRLQSQ